MEWGPHLQYSFLIKLAACDPYNNTPVIATGLQTETFKTTTAHASNRSTFSISHNASTGLIPPSFRYITFNH